MALSDQLTDLAGRTRRLEDSAAAARGKNKEKLEEQRKHLQASMDTQAESVRIKAAETKAETKGWWTQTTAKIEQRRSEFEAKRAEQEAQHSVEHARKYADDSAEFAEVLVTLASYVVDAAAYAVVDAAVAEERFEAMNKKKAPVGS